MVWQQKTHGPRTLQKVSTMATIGALEKSSYQLHFRQTSREDPTVLQMAFISAALDSQLLRGISGTDQISVPNSVLQKKTSVRRPEGSK